METNRNRKTIKFFIENRSMRSVAREIGLSETSFYKKMKTGQFSLREAEIISRSLQIEHPELIFFASDGT